MMENKIISLATFLFSKEKGFNEKVCRCGGYPDCICHDIPPTQSLLQAWLREKHNIQTYVIPTTTLDFKNRYLHREMVDFCITNDIDYKYYESYEEALESGLSKALQLIPKS